MFAEGGREEACMWFGWLIAESWGGSGSSITEKDISGKKTGIEELPADHDMLCTKRS